MSSYSLSSSLGRFNVIGIAEAISFLALLGIAMPLKYAANLPEAVKYTGWVHGLLFILYIFICIETAIAEKWSFKVSALAFFASLVPFGPFLFHKYILNK